jgi:hypothetical protein
MVSVVAVPLSSGCDPAVSNDLSMDADAKGMRSVPSLRRIKPSPQGRRLRIIATAGRAIVSAVSAWRRCSERGWCSTWR